MIEVKEALTKKQQKEFLEFPLKMYKNNPYFVPPLYGDEKKIFRSDFVYNDTCEAVYFNAYDGEKMVGRISGILQKAANAKNSERRVRFTRFDAIDDQAVADALFAAVEDWAISKGMDTVCGPLGFSDLEREGLLVEGFDQLSTFEEQYNAEYYGKLIENCGYEKEVDWLESKIYLPEDDEGRLEKTADYIMKRYNLHFGEAKNTRDFIDRYGDAFFELLDVAYENIYGTVPFTPGMKKMMIDNFMLIIDLKHVAVILDENNRLACLGICFPSIAKAVQKSQGRLTPAALVRLLSAIKKPKVIDLGLIAVDPQYANRGIGSCISAGLMRMLREDGIEYAETNLNLENNYAILNQWKRFRQVVHKRRRSYVKKLDGEI
ncbi:MAG: N-acetyltransferase [Clostridia bacterium]|nr:N-acetyltransferase [Clostridia bacterium]MBQ2191536.1 N-acetyltransferase [Clostridia bacterium]